MKRSEMVTVINEFLKKAKEETIKYDLMDSLLFSNMILSEIEKAIELESRVMVWDVE